MTSQQLLIGSRNTGPKSGVITIDDQTLVYTHPGTLLARSGYELTNLGIINWYQARSGQPQVRTPIGQWVTPVDAASLFEVYVSVPSIPTGTVSGILDSWQALTTTYLWYAEANINISSTAFATLIVMIRRIGQVSQEDSAEIVLSTHL